MKKIYMSLAGGLIALAMNAQQHLQQVIILNEGPYGGPVTVGSYNPSTKSYAVFDTINARFATDVIVDNGVIFVAADSLMVKYNADTWQKLDEQTVTGIRELAVWNSHLVVSRGDVASLSSYFQVYDKNTLDLVYEVTGISGDAAEVKVVGDTAYLAVNDFGSMGKLAVIDLNSHSLNREIDLGADGKNPENVEIGKDGKIFTVNSLDWSDMSVTSYDIDDASLVSKRLGTGGGCGASAMSHIGNIYFQSGSALSKSLGVFDAQTAMGFWDTLAIGKQIYGMGIDSVEGKIYVSETDFYSFGKVFRFDFYGNALDSFTVGISPGTIAMDVRNTAGTGELSGYAFMEVYPNPSTGKFLISAKDNFAVNTFTVTNILGEIVYHSSFGSRSQMQIDLTLNPSGIYFAMLQTEEGSKTVKLVKK